MEMEIAELALNAYNLVRPFLEKSGDSVASKIGEDIWALMKKPFLKKGKQEVENFAIIEPEEFKAELQNELKSNPELASQLTVKVKNAQTILNGNFNQTINSYDKVEKQINIQQNSGDITM